MAYQLAGHYKGRVVKTDVISITLFVIWCQRGCWACIRCFFVLPRQKIAAFLYGRSESCGNANGQPCLLLSEQGNVALLAAVQQFAA
ncbi:hypothetical protein ACFSQE_01290 [Vogesella fluminis]|uniref:hypothetical protein n=1 Tax=Vogesella fluminis TaxID=1069161 RepID=UPI00362BB61E